MIKRVLSPLYLFSSQIIKYPEQSEYVRLSKWLSMKSLCSRRQGEKFIELGLIRVDGKRVFENMLVPITANMKAFTPQGIAAKKPISKLWMLNKPRGYICSHNDPARRKTIYELLPKQIFGYGHIMSVGRLDFNSQGLLLLTNDSTLKNLLQNPAADMQRYYRVKVHGRVTEQKLIKLNQPTIIKGQQYGPLRVTMNRQLNTNVWLNVSLKTGKNREIRRIMQKNDLQVNKLIRLAYGKYKLGTLQLRELKQLEISANLQRKLQLQKAKEISANNKILIEIDLRQQAIKYAIDQIKVKEKQQLTKQQTKNIQDKSRNNKKQLQQDSEDE